MSSNARKGSPPRSSTTGITTLRSTKARVFVFLTLVILTAAFSANALTAANTQAAPTASGSFTASILSFFGFGSDESQKGVSAVPSATPPSEFNPEGKELPEGVDQSRAEAVDAASTFSGVIEAADPAYDRPVVPNNPGFQTGATTTTPVPDFDQYNFTVDQSGTYTIQETSTGTGATFLDAFTCVYSPTFNPATPLVNLLGCNDDNTTTTNSGGSLSLTAGTQYVYVISQLGSSVGPYTTTIAGPGNVSIAGNVGVACAAPGAGLVGFYEFEQNVNDSAPPASNGTVTGTATYGPGDVGSGFVFNGATLVDAGNPADFNFTNALTLAADVNPSGVVPAAGTFVPVLTKDNGAAATSSYFLGLVANGATYQAVLALRQSNGTLVLVQGGSVPVGAFTNIAATFDATSGTGRLYVNGTQVATATGTPGVNVNQTATTVRIGADNFGRFFTGTIDEVRLNNQVLTQAEIAAAASATSGLCVNVITLDSATSSITEGDSPAVTVVTYTLTRSGEISQPASVQVQTNPGGTAQGDAGSGCAAVGSDYQAITPPGTINFNANQATQSFSVTICNDLNPENTETYSVSIFNPVGATLGAITTNTTTITDNDFTTVTVTPVGGVLEDAAAGTVLTYTFNRVGPTANPLIVNFTVGGTACGAAACTDTNPTDYVATFGTANAGNVFTGGTGTTLGTGTIVIPAGASSATILIDPTPDTIVEPDETVIITPSNNQALAGGAQTGTILNDDQNITCAVAPTSTNEDGAGNLVFTCTRTGTTAAAQNVPFTFAGGTATFGTDYTILAAGSTTTGTPTSAGGTLNFAAGSSTATLTVDPTADTQVESDETVVFNVAPGGGFTVSPNPIALTGTILNDDFEVSVAVTNSPVSESGTTPLIFTFTRNGVNATAVTVNFQIGIGGNNAAFPADYTYTCGALPGTAPGTTCTIDPSGLFGTITIPSGGTSASNQINIFPTNDAATEPDETVTLSVIGGAGYNVAAAPANAATGTITNDDNAVSVTVAPATVGESSGGTMVYTFSRNGNTTQALTINFSVGGTATFTTDYTAGPGANSTPFTFTGTAGTVTFAIGSTTAIVNVTPVADSVVEVNGETVVLTVVAPVSGQNYTVGAPAAATGTITDDDTTVAVTVSPATVVENGVPNLVFTITRTGVTTGALVVNYTLTGTATNGTDYTVTPVTGTVTIADGASSATVTVDPTPDGVVEPDETVILTLTSCGVAANCTATGSATGTISNDDTGFRVQFIGITGAAVAGPGFEGNPGDPGDTIATFRVFRDGTNATGGSVDISTIPGSGTATAGAPNTVCQPGQDYTSDGRTITFLPLAPGAPGDSQDFTVRICRDLVFELTETFDVQLTNPTGGFIIAPADAIATATILDDDAAPFLRISDVTVNENAGTATLTVTQTTTTNTNTTFSFTTGFQGDTATANVDYTGTTGTGTIAAGQTSTTITIPIIDDNLDEPNEFFTVTLTSATNAVISPVGTNQADPTGIVTITDNELATTFAVSNVAQIEGNSASSDPVLASTSAFNFRITRTGDAQANETVCFETVDGDIENPAVNPNPATGGTSPGVPAGADYTSIVAGPTNCVNFTAGGPSVITVPVIVYGDNVFEFDESFTLRIVSVNGVANPTYDNDNNSATPEVARIIDRLGLGIIQNDDLAPVVTIANAPSVTEGNTPGAGGTITFTLTRTGDTQNATTVLASTSNGTGATSATPGTTCALNNGVDYITRTGVSVPFAAGATTATFTVTYCGDLYDENDEALTVTLTQPGGAVLGGSSSATAIILDDDAAPIISVSDVTVCEPNTGTAAAVFTINRTGLSYLPSTVTVSTVDGTATVADNDYVPVNAQVVTFPAFPVGTTPANNITAQTVSVTINGDTKFETDETFTLQVTSTSTDVVSGAAQGGDPIGLGVISNDSGVCAGAQDAAPTFAVGPVSQVEGTTNPVTPGTFFFRVTRTGTTSVPSSLTYSTTSGTATGGASCTAGVDFITVTNAQIAGGNFPAGGFSSQVGPPAQGSNFIDIPVQVCQDATFEDNETFNVIIATTNGFAQLSPTGTTATGTIVNDDGLTFSIRNPGPEGAEGTTGQTTNFVFTIDRVGDSSGNAVICYQTVAGTATEGVDYTGLTGTTNCSTFTPGQLSANVVVSVIGDTTPEPDETFFLRLISATVNGNAAPAGTIPTGSTGDRLATINNDDGPVVGPQGIEGDVVGANGEVAGDGLVLANDVSAIRQFILGNGTPTAGTTTATNQFQRADVNNNGIIDAGDVTIIRQMILGTVANNTPATGPTAPAAPRTSEEGKGGEANRTDAVGRIVRAVNTQTTGGSTVVVPIQLDSQGDEASLSFTVNFDPTRLTYVSAALGNGVPTGTNLQTNAAQAAQGRVGVLLDATNTYAAGTRQILLVTFTASGNANTAFTTPVSFTGTPTPLSTSNAQGVLLTTTYETGNVVAVVTAAGVSVSGRVTSSNGQGLRNATVTITDAAGNRRTATTGSFGIYTFEDVDAGQSYVVGVNSKRYRFSPRVVNVSDSIADVNFVGQE